MTVFNFGTKQLRLAALIGSAAALLWLAAKFLPPGIDWRDTYRPAALALLRGESPYSVDIFFAAPWSLVALLPFAILPESIGRAALFLLALVSYGYTAYKLGAEPPALGAFLASPIVVHGLLNSNIEWLALLGFVLPPQIGLLFVTIKPQIGLGVAFYWLVQAIRHGGGRRVVRDFLPVTIVTIISFALYGIWPLRFRDTIDLTRAYNASLWPLSIPVGVALLVLAFKQSNPKYAMAASPFLSPYVLFHAWVGALVSISRFKTAMIATVAALWIFVIVRAFTGAL